MERKRMKLLVLAAVALVGLLACQSLYRTYQYEVTGQGGSFKVTIVNEDGHKQQWAEVESGWTYTWEQWGVRSLSVSATNLTDYGDVTVRIIRDGVIVAENTSYGAYVTATVSGDY